MSIADVRPISRDELNAGVEAVLAAGAPFEVMPMTVRGVDYPRVFALSNVSLREVLALKTQEHQDKPFIVYGDMRLTTGEVWARSMRFANWLKARGIGQGDRVAIAMRNYPEWAFAYLGIIASGAAVVPLNAWWQADELHYGVEASEVKLVVCDAKRAEMLAPCKEKFGLTFIAGREDVPHQDEHMHQILADDSISMQMPTDPIDPDSDYCLLFTSGSTGRPKGAMLTHRGVVSAILSWSFLLTVLEHLRPEVQLTPDKPGTMLCVPLFHVTGLHSLFLLSYLSGRKLVMIDRWDPKAAAKIAREEKLTNFVGVPTMAYDLVKAAEPGDLATMRDIGTGGSKRPEAQVQLQYDLYPDISASSGYGMTETNALGTHIALGDYAANISSTGRAIPPVTEIATFTEDGQRLPDGEVGEICIKSPANMRGYLANEEATKAVFFDGGWLRTGDLGYVNEEGYLFIQDRLKDMIIRGGENISCPEVENVLHEVQGVDEVAVFGVPHETLGEVVGAVVYGSDALELQTLREHAATRLAHFKVPTRIWRSPTMLPRGTTGKIDKKMIRTIAAEHPPHLQQGDD
ncbi:MAG: class I adenylate-forming enzyme family protein [Pseudomonadota bacterium]